MTCDFCKRETDDCNEFIDVLGRIWRVCVTCIERSPRESLLLWEEDKEDKD